MTSSQFCEQCGAGLAQDCEFCEQCGHHASSGLTDFSRVRQLFGQAMLVDPSGREAWLVEACGNDQAVFAEVRSMVCTPQNSFLSQPAAPPPAAEAPSVPPLSSPLGPPLAPPLVRR